LYELLAIGNPTILFEPPEPSAFIMYLTNIRKTIEEIFCTGSNNDKIINDKLCF
jgi:hypothetical protein